MTLELETTIAGITLSPMSAVTAMDIGKAKLAAFATKNGNETRWSPPAISMVTVMATRVSIWAKKIDEDSRCNNDGESRGAGNSYDDWKVKPIAVRTLPILMSAMVPSMLHVKMTEPE